MHIRIGSRGTIDTQPAAPPHRKARLALGMLVAVLFGALALGALIPALSQSRQPTELCLEHAAQLAKAMRMYAQDWGDYLFNGRGDPFSPPLTPGQAGQTPHLKMILRDYLPPARDDLWFCPADAYAHRDFTSDPRWSGTFTYREAGIGYVAARHASDRDPGIGALRTQLLAHFGADNMRADHGATSYRYLAFPQGSPPEAQALVIDAVFRAYRVNWGAYGYWDINPSDAELFEEDLPFHTLGRPDAAGIKIYGKTFSFRDGHAVFRTYDARGFNNYGELDYPD